MARAVTLQNIHLRLHEECTSFCLAIHESKIPASAGTSLFQNS